MTDVWEIGPLHGGAPLRKRDAQDRRTFRLQVLPGLRGQGLGSEAEEAVLEGPQGEARLIEKRKCHDRPPQQHLLTVIQESKEAYFVALKRKPNVNLH